MAENAGSDVKPLEELTDVSELLKTARRMATTEHLSGQFMGLFPTIGGAPEFSYSPEDCYKKALEVALEDGDPDQEHLVRSMSAGYYSSRGRYDDALVHAKRCVELKPKDPGSRDLLAHMFGVVARTRESSAEYFKAAKLYGIQHPGDMVSRAGVGVLRRFGL